MPMLIAAATVLSAIALALASRRRRLVLWLALRRALLPFRTARSTPYPHYESDEEGAPEMGKVPERRKLA